jgi:sortase (surface protein transpeptidase)
MLGMLKSTAPTAMPRSEPRRTPATADAIRREPPRAPVVTAAARSGSRRGSAPRVVRRSLALAVVCPAMACGSAESAPIVDPPSAPTVQATEPVAKPKRAATPVRVVIPRIGVDAPLIRLGLDGDGALEVPERFDVAGWWTGGARPGERGPAVIAGHVDSKTGPAVFYAIGTLRRGDRVIVRRRDGSSVRFRVRRSERYAKQRFPTRRVYGPTRRPELRLITCSGTFDRASGHYLDNTVVYATA